MTNVFLARCDSPNFDTTVTSGVDLSQYPEPPATLDGFGDSPVRFWGAGAGTRNESNFEKMAVGDLVLFYRDGTYVGTAWVDTKFKDKTGWASDTVWNDGDARLLYTLTDFEPVSIPREKVNRIFDYTDGYTPSELLRVSDSNVTRQPAAIKLALQRYSKNN